MRSKPPVTDIDHFWQEAAERVLNKLHVDANTGLTSREAHRRLKRYGSNLLKQRKKYGCLRLLFAQFNSPLIYLLLFAAGLSMLLYDRTDALIIFIIIALSTLLSFFQERSALMAMDKLLDIVQVTATVRREGRRERIATDKIVPGDIVEFSAGDIIPCDCYLLGSKDLYVDEAALTGESFYAEKQPGIAPADAGIAQRFNTLFMGTHVVSGTATAVAVKTGAATEFGRISGKLAYTPPQTEFELGIRHFGALLLEVTFFLLMLIFAFNVYLERPVVESMLFALALAVGLTPQLLPAVISINLAHGAKSMAQQSVIVKRLASIENFGSMNVLCADKTGTITTGEVSLVSACDADGKPNSKTALYAYQNAALQSGYVNPIDKALTDALKSTQSPWVKIDEIPYDFTRKRLSVLTQEGAGKVIITKGAFHQVLEACSYVERGPGEVADAGDERAALEQTFTRLCSEGYRVLAVAYRPWAGEGRIDVQDEKEMTFLGFLLFTDPPKPGIAATVSNLKDLGISLKIITGDNRLAARHTADLLGISEEQVLTGQEIRQMSDSALFYQVQHKHIFAEIEPNQKERIVLALRKSGNVVGYLGDGINDVTALHAADVSIAVDGGADAAKEVADIVLLKHDLSVLEGGVKAGRTTFANTLKYIFMATSANFGNMFSMAGASLFLSFLPLLPKQVLLINLMTDFPELTIAGDRVDDEMIQRPLRWNIAFIRKFMTVFGLISSVFDYMTFGILLWIDATVVQFRTGWFVESVVSATCIVLVVRTFKPFYRSRPSGLLLGAVAAVVVAAIGITLSPLAAQLGFGALPPAIYLWLGGIVCTYVAVVEGAKRIFLRRWLQEL